MSLVELLAPLRRRWRLILFGVGGSWALLLLVFLLTPPRYRCEATLALPNLTPPARPRPARPMAIGSALQPMDALERESVEREGLWDKGQRTGIPYSLYEEVERSLHDGAALQSAFGEGLDPASVERVRLSLAARVSPLTGGVADDKDRSVVTAVLLSDESASPEGSREVVSTLASMMREALITTIGRELIAWEAQSSERAIRSLTRGKELLLEANASLQELATDLERLAREMPGERRDAGREIVDIRGGGHLYLPPWLQLVGAKGRRVDNEQAIRTDERALARHALRLEILRRVDRRLEAMGTSIVSDVPGVIAEEIEKVRQEQEPERNDSGPVQTELRTLGDELAALATQTRFIQHPTVGTVPRDVTAAAALASLAVVFFVGAAFVIDLWGRSAPPRDAGGTAAHGTSP